MKTTENSENRILVGIDLHGNYAVCGVVDGSGKRLKEKRLPCDLEKIVDWLSPLRERIDTIAIESTYNWYWLVDGLAANGFKVVLANPAKIVQYEGIKHADDANDDTYHQTPLRRRGLVAVEEVLKDVLTGETNIRHWQSGKWKGEMLIIRTDRHSHLPFLTFFRNLFPDIFHFATQRPAQ